MSSYLPSFKRSVPAPVDDAPLHALPAVEAQALSLLEEHLSKQLYSATAVALHRNDPWQKLPSDIRRSLALRFLRYQALHVERTAAHLDRVARWRAEDQPWMRSPKLMRGPQAGVPLLRVDARGFNGEVLLYSPAKLYIRAEVDHAVQEVAIKTFFENLLYSKDGPLALSGILVVDFHDMQMRNVDIVATKNGIRIFLNYYPEVFKKILVVNYAKWLYGTWRCIVPLLDARTVQKVEWLSTAAEVRTVVTKYFADQDVPRWLGGDGKDGELQLYTGASIDPDEVARSMQ